MTYGGGAGGSAILSMSAQRHPPHVVQWRISARSKLERVCSACPGATRKTSAGGVFDGLTNRRHRPTMCSSQISWRFDAFQLLREARNKPESSACIASAISVPAPGTPTRWPQRALNRRAHQAGYFLCTRRQPLANDYERPVTVTKVRVHFNQCFRGFH